MKKINKKQVLSNEHLKVYDIINNSQRTIITKQMIFNQLQMEFNKANDRWLRNVVHGLVVDYGYPIGYSYKKDAKGYFIIRNEQQKEQAMLSIKRHIEGSMKRYKALEKLNIKEKSEV